MSGSDKRPLFIIGKNKQPRCFPRDLSRLPVEYDSNKNAWMTSVIFKTWLQQWDQPLKVKKRTVCLLVDNCSAHPSNVELTNIVLKFLPPNTTSVMQPMDMGVIRNWKGYYRSQLACRVIASLDADPEKQAIDVVKGVTLLDALYLAKEAWGLVSCRTVKNCFVKGGFYNQDAASLDPLSDVSRPPSMSEEEFQDYIDSDQRLEVATELTDAELLEAVQGGSGNGDVDGSDDESDPPPLSLSQKMLMVDYLRKFVQETGLQTTMVKQIETVVFSEAIANKRQRTLDSYVL